MTASPEEAQLRHEAFLAQQYLVLLELLNVQWTVTPEIRARYEIEQPEEMWWPI